jgi:hypothetical protein
MNAHSNFALKTGEEILVFTITVTAARGSGSPLTSRKRDHGLEMEK